jgi:hypothetical protein
MNGVVADAAFRNLPASKTQRFNFRSLQRSTRKHGVGGSDLRKPAYSGLSRSLKIDSDCKPFVFR